MTWELLEQRIREREDKIGPEEPLKILVKMMEELGEVSECVLKRWPDKLGVEIADVLICTIIFAHKYGIDPLAEMHKKMDILETRTGKVRDGIYVKDEDHK